MLLDYIMNDIELQNNIINNKTNNNINTKRDSSYEQEKSKIKKNRTFILEEKIKNIKSNIISRKKKYMTFRLRTESKKESKNYFFLRNDDKHLLDQTQSISTLLSKKNKNYCYNENEKNNKYINKKFNGKEKKTKMKNIEENILFSSDSKKTSNSISIKKNIIKKLINNNSNKQLKVIKGNKLSNNILISQKPNSNNMEDFNQFNYKIMKKKFFLLQSEDPTIYSSMSISKKEKHESSEEKNILNKRLRKCEKDNRNNFSEKKNKIFITLPKQISFMSAFTRNNKKRNNINNIRRYYS